jgi:hypothetical protein
VPFQHHAPSGPAIGPIIGAILLRKQHPHRILRLNRAITGKCRAPGAHNFRQVLKRLPQLPCSGNCATDAMHAGERGSRNAALDGVCR